MIEEKVKTGQTKEEIDRALEGYGVCICGHPSFAHNGRWNKGSCRISDCWCHHQVYRYKPRKKVKQK